MVWSGHGIMYLGPSEHHSIKENLEFLERRFTWAGHPVLLDRCQDLVVPEASLKNSWYENKTCKQRSIGVRVASAYAHSL